MREIKFRAWDGEKVFDPIIRFDPFVKLAPHTLLTDREGGKWINDYELMQYTGLKDKNGVDIYEGDIVGDYDNDCFGDSDGSYSCKRMGVIVCDDPETSFNIKFIGCDCRHYSLVGIRNSEVIGNIHENKGLLEND